MEDNATYYESPDGMTREQVIKSTEASIQAASRHPHPTALIETRPGTFEMTCATCNQKIATVTLFAPKD